MEYTKEAISKRKRRSNFIKRIIILILYIIIIPVIAYNLIVIVKSIINPNVTPDIFGIKTFVIVSGSMQPDMNIGDIVIANSKSEILEVGDIVSYKRGDYVVTHRIIEIQTDENGIQQYITKGDNNNAKDASAISANDVEGKVIYTIKGFGKLTLFLQNKLVVILIILLCYLIYVHRRSVNEAKEDRHKKRELYEAMFKESDAFGDGVKKHRMK